MASPSVYNKFNKDIEDDRGSFNHDNKDRAVKKTVSHSPSSVETMDSTETNRAEVKMEVVENGDAVIKLGPDLSELILLSGDVERNPGPVRKQAEIYSSRRTRGQGHRTWNVSNISAVMKTVGISATKVGKKEAEQILMEIGAATKVKTRKSLQQYIKYHQDELKSYDMIDQSTATTCNKETFIDNAFRRERKVKRFSSNWITTARKKNVFCKCKKPYRKDGPIMIQCERCSEWYHLPCIGIRAGDISAAEEEDITFICGIGECDASKRCFIVNLNSSVNDLFQNRNNMVVRTPVAKQISKLIPNTLPTPTHSLILETDTDDNETDKIISCSKMAKYYEQTHKLDDDKIKCRKKSNIVNSPHVLEDSDVISKQKQSSSSLSVKAVSMNDSKAVVDHSMEDVTAPPVTDIIHKNQSNDFEESIFSTSPISKETMEICFSQIINDRFFTKEIPSHAAFKICNSSWDRIKALFSTSSSRCLPRNSWQDIFLDGLKKSNQYCVHIFDEHRVSRKILKSSASKYVPLFSSNGHCKFSDCTITFSLKMHDSENVQVLYTGVVRHDIRKEHARPISGFLRAQYQKILADGPKPYKMLLDQAHLTPSSVIIAGNCDKYGVSRSVLQKISSEGRQQFRRDSDVVSSLMQMSKEFEAQTDERKIPGFIQCIMFKPLCILYWTEVGIRLYHDLAKHDAIFWDATGSVVKKHNGQEVLLYEIVCRNPEKNQPVIPVTAMLTVCRSVSYVQFWLSCFRSQEQKIFGHSNCVQVKLIISDRALVFILAALKEFNNESYLDFLNRAWRIVTGQATAADMKLTNPHACLSHVMKSCKNICLKHYKGNFRFGMYCFSALLHAATLSEATHIMKSLANILLSKGVTPDVENNCLFLNAKINSLPQDKEIKTIVSTATEVPQIDEENVHVDVNPNRYTEEDYLSKGHGSCFQKWVDKTISDVEVCISTSTAPHNRRYGPVFLAKLQKLLLPSFPLWSNILLGDLRRHGSTDAYSQCKNDTSNPSATYRSSKQPATGNSTVEERFRVVKDLVLGGRSSRRIDEFSGELEKNYRETERLVMRTSLKVKVKRKWKPSTKANKTVSESWKKKKDSTPLSAIPLGVYQKAPRNSFSVPSATVNAITTVSVDEKTEVCKQNKLNENNIMKVNKQKSTPLNILGDGSKLPTTVSIEDKTEACKQNKLNEENKMKLNKDKSTPLNILGAGSKLPTYSLFKRDSVTGLRNMSNNCWFNAVLQAFCRTNSFIYCLDNMQANLGYLERYRSILQLCHYSVTGVEDELLLSKALSLTEKDGFVSGQQHDAHEFFTQIISCFLDYKGDRLAINRRITCTECGMTRDVNDSSQGHEIDLPVPTVSECSDLLCVRDLLQVYFQTECIQDLVCSFCTRTGNCMSNLHVSHSPNDVVVILKRYSIDRYKRTVKNSRSVIIDDTVMIGESEFTLHSVVRHHGERPQVGHYTTILKMGSSYLECNDKKISIEILGEAYDDAYILVYNKSAVSLTVNMKMAIMCISGTKAIEKLNVLFDASDARTVGRCLFCKTLSECTFTHDVAQQDSLSLDRLYSLLEINKCLQTDGTLNDMLQSLFHGYLFYYMPASMTEYFGIGVNELKSCKTCGTQQSKQNKCYIGKVTSFQEHDMENIKPQCVQSPTVCQCVDRPEINEEISGFGATICIESSGESVWELILSGQQITLSSSVHPFIRITYEPVSVISKDFSLALLCKSSYRIVKASGDFHTIGQVQDLHDTLERQNELIVFFDKVQETVEKRYHVNEATAISEMFSEKTSCCKTYMPITHDATERAVIHFTDSFQVGGFEITAEDCIRFLNGELTDNCIDVYLQHLKTNVVAATAVTYHFVSAAWFKDRLTGGVVGTAQSKTCWFSCTIVFLPINIENEHWMLCIIDTETLTIFYVDSLGHFDNEIAVKIVRYLSYEYHRFHHSPLDTEKLTFVQIAKAKDFNIQTDATSCGIYVCLFTKCYIANCLPQSFESMKLFRLEILNELMQTYYFNRVPASDKITLRDVLLCDDTDKHVKNIMCSPKESVLLQYTRHNAFLCTSTQHKEAKLIGFGQNFVTAEQQSVIMEYLLKKYFILKKGPKLFSHRYHGCVFEEAVSLENCLKSGLSNASVYVLSVLLKEVLIFRRMKQSGMTYKTVNASMTSTEFSLKAYVRKYKELKSKMIDD